MRLGGRWDDKGVYLFYLELITDLFHMLVYLAFFILICTYYGLVRRPTTQRMADARTAVTLRAVPFACLTDCRIHSRLATRSRSTSCATCT